MPSSSELSPPRGARREVASLALPIMGSQLAHTLTAAVDSAFVGQLGADELAAVGLGGAWLWTGFSFFMGTATGVQTFVSQADGAGERERCGAWLWQALYGLVPASILVVLVVAPLIPWLLSVAALAPEMQASANDYVSARLPGEVAAVFGMVVASFFRGVGDARTPLLLGIVTNLVNVVLDWALIFGNLGMPALGVQGAGLATSIALAFGAALSFAVLVLMPRLRVFEISLVRPRLSALRRFLRTSGPIGAQWLVGSASFSGWTAVVASLGAAPMAASQATMVLMNLSFMPAYGLSIAVSTLAGRYKGADDPEAVTRSLRNALGLGAVVCAVVAAALLGAPHALFGFFSNDPEVLALARPMLAMSSLFLIFDATSIVVSGALRGAGDTRFPFWLESTLSWTLFLPGGWLFGIALGGGVMGAWLGALIFVVALATGMALRFRSGAWQHIRI